MSIEVNKTERIVNVTVEKKYGKDGAPFTYDMFTQEQLDGLKVSPEGSIETGNIQLDNPSGKIYGDDAELTGDLTIDDNTAKLGGAAIVYHRDSVAPNINTGLQKIEIDSYTVNDSNMITLQKIGASKLGVVYKTIVIPDTENPSIPTNLVATNTTDTTTDLNWDASTDNIGVTSYKVYQDGVEVANPATNSYQVTGLTAETPYSFTVTALDEAGNESGVSNTESITTLEASAPDIPYLADSIMYANAAYAEDITVDGGGGITEIVNRADTNNNFKNLSGTDQLAYDATTKEILFNKDIGGKITCNGILINTGACTVTFAVDFDETDTDVFVLYTASGGVSDLRLEPASSSYIDLRFSGFYPGELAQGKGYTRSAEGAQYTGKVIVTLVADSVNGLFKIITLNQNVSYVDVWTGKTVGDPVTKTLNSISEKDIYNTSNNRLRAVDVKNTILTETQVKEIQNFLADQWGITNQWTL